MSYGEELMYEMQADEAFYESRAENMLAAREWMTRDGSCIEVSNMTNSHLLNCIRLFDRGGSGCFCGYEDEARAMLICEAVRRGLVVGE